MIKHIILSLVIIAIILLSPTTAYTQEEISLINSSTAAQFPTQLVFNIKTSSINDITRIRLIYRVNKMNYANVISEAWPSFTPSPVVDTNWTWDMRRSTLPPGAQIEYWWKIEDSKDNSLITPVQTISFDDSNHSWQTLTSGKVTFLWYEGNRAFANNLMEAAEQALHKLADDTGAVLEKPVKIFIYHNSTELQKSMIFPREWTGGVAFTKYGTIAIGVSEDNLDWGKDAVAHELGHMVTHQITFSPYGHNLPTWLDEGLAMHAESGIDPSMPSRLKKALSKQKLISIRSLSSPFSAKAEEAYISYAQSQSIVNYLIDVYGKDKMLNLLLLLKEGSTIDDALIETYSFDQDMLDLLWQETLKDQ
ncbi:peptidase MA family metallohydrolase [Chloroflexota bacterium]